VGRAEKTVLTLLITSGLVGLAVLVFGFSKVHCVKDCGSIIKFQYFHYRNLLFAFIGIQAFGWYMMLNVPVRAVKWSIVLAAFLILLSLWVYGVVWRWDSMATFYFGNLAPIMNKFFLL
jgi:hypothetical protein